MTISAKVILDSIADNGVRLVTCELTYPRIIHSEFMTHRVFTRNAASSRAIPTKKKIERIRLDMAEPSEWGLNKPGMQSDQALSPEDQAMARQIWRATGLFVLEQAEKLDQMKVHKQVANRILEPWDHITTVVSATKLKNHFKLRREVDPETGRPLPDPTYYELAGAWEAALNASTPMPVAPGEWHLPYVQRDVVIDGVKQRTLKTEDEDLSLIDPAVLKKVSAGRCARVSYMRQGQGDLEENETLHARLVKGGHWAPLEHPATPILGLQFGQTKGEACDFCHCWFQGRRLTLLNFGACGDKHLCMKCGWGHCHSGNFHGWHQYRKEFADEAGGD